MDFRRLSFCCCLAFYLLASVGCGTGYDHNPSFFLSVDEADDALQQMQQNPRKLSRPVVVLGGWGDEIRVAKSLAEEIKRVTGDDRVLPIDYSASDNLVHTQFLVVKKINEAFPSKVPGKTVEVDVVAYSMGGLVARYAARRSDTDPNQPTLNIVRLFTISTPHRGARFADLPAIDSYIPEMRRDSAFIAELSKPDYRDDYYRIYPYVRLGDIYVGAENAAPPYRTPWWVPNMKLEDAHWGAYRDPRLLADIARRLRNEAPYTRYPPAPLPRDSDKSTPSTTDAVLHNAGVAMPRSGA